MVMFFRRSNKTANVKNRNHRRHYGRGRPVAGRGEKVEAFDVVTGKL